MKDPSISTDRGKGLFLIEFFIMANLRAIKEKEPDVFYLLVMEAQKCSPRNYARLIQSKTCHPAITEIIDNKWFWISEEHFGMVLGRVLYWILYNKDYKELPEVLYTEVWRNYKVWISSLSFFEMPGFQIGKTKRRHPFKRELLIMKYDSQQGIMYRAMADVFGTHDERVAIIANETSNLIITHRNEKTTDSCMLN